MHLGRGANASACHAKSLLQLLRLAGRAGEDADARAASARNTSASLTGPSFRPLPMILRRHCCCTHPLGLAKILRHSATTTLRAPQAGSHAPHHSLAIQRHARARPCPMCVRCFSQDPPCCPRHRSQPCFLLPIPPSKAPRQYLAVREVRFSCGMCSQKKGLSSVGRVSRSSAGREFMQRPENPWLMSFAGCCSFGDEFKKARSEKSFSATCTETSPA